MRSSSCTDPSQDCLENTLTHSDIVSAVMGLTTEPTLSITNSTRVLTKTGVTQLYNVYRNPEICVTHTSPTATQPAGKGEYTDLEEGIDKRNSSMDYNWLGSHDPITIDANLAEIDFDDFKNEDIQNAYAYSLQSYDDASSSGTDMSICRSEALFSSYKDAPGTSESLIQDSLTTEDFNYSEGLAVNKNNYTLTFSGHTSISSQAQPQEYTNTHGGSLPNKDDVSERYTTWSNMVKQKEPASATTEHGERGERGRTRTREENNINNNMDSSRKSRSLPNISKEKPLIKHAWKATDEDEEKFQHEILSDEPNLIKLYLQQRGDRNSWNGTSRCDYYESSDTSFSDDAFVKDNDLAKIPPLKNKDAVNNFLKTASKLTSIEENSELSSGGSTSEHTVRPVPTPRQRSVSSRSSMSTTPSLQSCATSASSRAINSSRSEKRASKTSGDLPTLDFLENDVGLWDAFFMHTKNSSKFQSVLKPALPVEEYLQDHLRRGAGSKQEIRDLSSLRVLLPNSQKHLIPGTSKENDGDKPSPIRQVCTSLSQLNSSQKHIHQRELQNQQNQAIKSMSNNTAFSQPKVVQVKEAWVPGPEHVQGYVPDWDSYQRQSDKTSQILKMRPASADKNLNLINNNKSSQEEKAEKASKRRSYHPQDFLSKILTSPSHPEENSLKQHCQKLQRSHGFPKSGSHGNLCDSWQDEPSTPTSESSTPSSSDRRKMSAIRSLPAEYPFQANLGLPQQAINFDLTHKRGLFVSLYAAVERLLLYQDQSNPAYSSKAACRCILLHEFCPALHTILEDGLKEEVITSFGRMKTSVWRVIEAVMQAGPAQRNTFDLVMLLNTKFSSEEDFKKFSGFVIGLLNMSCLHIWFSKLKWSLDVLLRFYERHAFICALHKETKLLFDELNFCLQRLYSIPFHVDMPFNDSILEEITTAEVYKKREHCQNCACTRTPTTGSEGSSCFTSNTGTNTIGSGGSRPDSADSSRTSRSSKSRIPRPISLPKRLEDKLSIRASRSPQRASSAGGNFNAKSNVKPPLKSVKSPVKPVIPPRPKSRVRDTVKLFDAKSNKAFRGQTAVIAQAAAGTVKMRKPVKATSPKTGGGEGMVPFDSGGDPFR